MRLAPTQSRSTAVVAAPMSATPASGVSKRLAQHPKRASTDGWGHQRRGRDSNPSSGVGNNLKRHATLHTNARKFGSKAFGSLSPRVPVSRRGSSAVGRSLGSGWAVDIALPVAPFRVCSEGEREMIMARDTLTMRETCEALGVSRAMVQKLEATGELAGERESGRVLFDRDKVEALRTSREVAKVQRKQETEDREFRAIDVEADRHELESMAWSKTTAEQNQKDKADRAIEALRTGIDELRGAERKREHEATLARISTADHRGAAQGSELLEVATILAPAAAVLCMAYLAREKGKTSPAPAEAGLDAVDGGTTGASRTATGVDLAERLLIDKIASHTATQDDLGELATLLWRRLHP